MFWEISQNSQESTCARVSFLIKLQLYEKRDFGTGVFLWILRNFSEHLFLQNTSGGCFCICILPNAIMNTVSSFRSISTLGALWEVSMPFEIRHIWKSWKKKQMLKYYIFSTDRGLYKFTDLKPQNTSKKSHFAINTPK